jgi:CHAT domain-containing protein
MAAGMDASFAVHCQRLQCLADCDPRRAVVLARRTCEHSSATDYLSHARATYTLGYALVRWERISAARSYLEAALTDFSTLNQHVFVLHCRRALLLTDLPGGSSNLQQQLKQLALHYRETSMSLEAVRTDLLQMWNLNRQGQPHATLLLAAHTAPLIQARGTRYDQGWHARLVGHALALQGQLPAAASQIEHALDCFAQARCPLERARSQVILAGVYQRREQPTAALDALDQALRGFRRLDMPAQIAECEKNVGQIAAHLGQYDQALTALVNARTLYGALHNSLLRAHCDVHLGNIAYYSGLHDLASGLYQRAWRVYVQHSSHRYALICQRNQALVYHAQGRFGEALTLLDAIEPEQCELGDMLELAETMHLRGKILRERAQSSIALHWLRAAHTQFVQLGNRSAAAQCRLDEGWLLLEQAQPARAEACFRSALPDLTEQPHHIWRLHYGLGCCAAHRGAVAVALNHYRHASTIVARLRRALAMEHPSSSIFRQARQLFIDTLRFAADQHDALTVLMLAEQQRTAVLPGQILMLPRHLAPEWHISYEHQREALYRLTAVSADTDAFPTELTDYMDTLIHMWHRVSRPATAEELLPDVAALREQLQTAYPTGWTVLLYEICDDEILIVALDTEAEVLTRIPLDAELQQLLARATLPNYRQMTYFDLNWRLTRRGTAWATLTTLGQLLLPPAVCARLHPTHRLLIVPGGMLHALPWAGLRVADSWLCERAIIQCIPGLAIWSKLAACPAQGTDALLVGCSSFGGRAEPLPGVPESLSLVAQHWPGTVERLEDQAGTRARLRACLAPSSARAYRLLHIASHAQLLEQHGLLAHIKLWDDDMLLHEVARLTLHGTLVVLETCDGTAGDVLPGEEVLSLSRAFLAAGASDVIASLWPVYDQATRSLLQPLYIALAQGHDAPTALAIAQRALIARETSANKADYIIAFPFVWAGFCTLGAGIHRLPTTEYSTDPSHSDFLA